MTRMYLFEDDLALEQEFLDEGWDYRCGECGDLLTADETTHCTVCDKPMCLGPCAFCCGTEAFCEECFTERWIG